MRTTLASLWVTGEIMRRNGWDIRVRSRCGPHRSGTVFSITMPLQSSAARIESAVAVA
jgi:signal transduction histidine kinase